MGKDSIIQIAIAPSNPVLGDLIASLEMVSSRFLPNTTQAIKMAVKTLEYTWKSYAMGAEIPGTSLRLHSVRGGYAKSIKSVNRGLSGMVYSDSPYAAEIEDGTEEKDLKKTIPYGPKSRMGKNGPYSIIPMRHGAPKSLSAPMPAVLYRNILKKLRLEEIKKSSVLQQKAQSVNAQGQMVQRNTYKWGTSIKNTGFPDLEGLVVMNVPSSKNEKRSAYLTFRVITANKPKIDRSKKGWENSWIVPAKMGLNVTKYVVANTQEIVAELIKSGISFDLES